MTSELGREGVFVRLVDDIVGYVGDSLSVHLVGLHGSGRSELLGLVADRLDDSGWTVLRLYGNPAWKHEPFAALTAAGIGPANAPGPRRFVGEMSAALAQQLRGGVVVVCDDADSLDLHSVGALLTVHQQRRLVVVTGSRPQQPVSPDSFALGLTPAVRLRMPYLDVDAVHTVCRSLLGQPVDAGTLARITMNSGGLHGLVRAIVTISRHAGTLQLHDGIWTLAGDLWTEQLAAAVQHYLAGADQAVWDGATTLALTGPVRLEEAEKLLERRVLDQLFTAGLVHHSDDGGHGVVGLFPPLLAEYLRREGSPFGLARARDLTGDTTFLPTPYDGQGAFDPGQAAGVDAAVLNQRLARQAADAVLAARRAWQAAPTAETAIDLLGALRAASSPATEVELVAETTPLGEEREAAAMLAVWYAHWRAVDRADLDGALGVLVRHEQLLPRFVPLLRLTAAHLTYLRDRVPDEPDIDGSFERTVHEARTCLRAERLLAAGLVDQARTLLAGFHPTHRVFASDAAVLTGLAAILAGDLTDGIGHASDQLHAARARSSAGSTLAHSYVAVLGLVLSGRLGDAAQVLFRTLAMTTVASFRGMFHTGLLVLGAEIAIGQGRPEFARALAAQAAATGSGRGPYPAMDHAVVDHLLPGTPPESGPALWDVVSDRLERGYVSNAIVLAADAVERATDLPRAEAVQRLAKDTESPLLQALGDYVLALASEDEAQLAAVGDELARIGAVHHAVRAAVHRAVVLRRLDRAAEAAGLADAAWRLSAVAGYERSGLFASLQADVGLSARELEIVSLVCSGRTTAELASELQMSTRTVETHLHNVSRKVGISGREQLVKAGTTWLQP